MDNPDSNWDCSVCTFKNSSGVLACEICNHERPSEVIMEAPKTKKKKKSRTNLDTFIANLKNLNAKKNGKKNGDSKETKKPVVVLDCSGNEDDSKMKEFVDLSKPIDLEMRVCCLEEEVTELKSNNLKLKQMHELFVNETLRRYGVFEKLFEDSGLDYQGLVTEGEIEQAQAVRDMLNDLKVAKIIENWKSYAIEKKERREQWIRSHSYMWRSACQERVRIRHEKAAELAGVLAMLEERKANGEPLTLVEENFLVLREFVDEGKQFECKVCFGDYGINELVFMDCGHCLCVECMERYVVSQLDTMHANSVVCPLGDTGCTHVMSFGELRTALLNNIGQLKRLEGFLLESCLEKDPLMARCPKPECQTPMIRPSQNDTMCVCPNPKCGYTFCSSCRVEWHSDSTCDEYQQWKKDNAHADDFFARWREKHTKQCPECNTNIEKNGGCNHMTCSRCRYEFCWLCLGNYDGGRHFKRNSNCNMFT